MIVAKVWFLVVMYNGIGGINTPRVDGHYMTEEECTINMPVDKKSNCIYSEYHLYSKDELLSSE